MTRYAFALATLILAGGPAWAGDGGKIQWRTGREYDAALAEAKAIGRPVMLYFTGDG